jgi:cytochrome c-type biogenesis protein CcmH
MAIWMLFGAMTALVVMAVLWPLSRRGAQTRPADDADLTFYRDQLAEIDRDSSRGLLSPAEAEAARAEAGRRLLRATSSSESGLVAVGEPALRRRRAVSALALSVLPITALAVYGAYGSPQLTATTVAVKQKDPAQLDLATALNRIESHLAANPEDGRGWDLVGPVYLRLGRAEDAVKAFSAALRILGEDASRLASYGEAQVAAQGGIVPAEARQAFERAVALDASAPRPRFYLARAAEQDGDTDRAKDIYRGMLAAAPADAPWVPLVQEQLARLDEPDQAVVPNGEAIAGMVEGLARRLVEQGGSPEEWGRLVRSYVVLGDRDKATSALEKSCAASQKNPEVRQQLDQLAQELELSSKP